MTAPQQVIALLDAAIKRFGTYNLHDKGASEVMDVEEVVTILREAGTDTTIDTLLALSAHENGEPVIHYLIMVFVEDDEWPEFTEALLASPYAATYAGWLVPDE